MTTRWPHILLSTFCLLAVATSASAECSWVLWQNYPHVPDRLSYPVDTFSSKAACEASAEGTGLTIDHVAMSPRHRGPAWTEGLTPGDRT
jgi:hypothetical protein